MKSTVRSGDFRELRHVGKRNALSPLPSLEDRACRGRVHDNGNSPLRTDQLGGGMKTMTRRFRYAVESVPFCFPLFGCTPPRMLPDLHLQPGKAAEVYIVPQRYRGPLVVIYSDTLGIRPEARSDDRVHPSGSLRTFRIPASGFLRIRAAQPAASTTIRIVESDQHGGAVIPLISDCQSVSESPRTTELVGCLIPPFATTALHPLPFYLAALITDSANTHVVRTAAIRMVVDSVFLGRLKLPTEWLSP